MKIKNLDNIKAIILVEGLTEQFLLPYFAASYNIDLLGKGIMIVPAGGANKLVRKYGYWRKQVDLPIFCLFDADAANLANSLLPGLKPTDSVYILPDGEIEDSMQLDFLVDSVNNYLAEDPLYDNSKAVCAADFAPGEKRTVILDKIWRQKKLAKFEKVKFAQFLANQTNGMAYSMDSKFLTAGGQDMLKALAKFIDRNELNK